VSIGIAIMNVDNQATSVWRDIAATWRLKRAALRASSCARSPVADSIGIEQSNHAVTSTSLAA